jgi:hypothetical protein
MQIPGVAIAHLHRIHDAIHAALTGYSMNNAELAFDAGQA